MSRTILVGAIGVLVVIGVGALALAFSSNQQQEPATGQDQQQNQSFADQVGQNIVGIEPGAGVMINTETAMEEYGLNQAGWNLQESSSAAMMASFQDAVENQEPVVATLWEPHALFSVADIRKLDDPNNIYNNPQATTAFLEEYAPDWAEAEVASDIIATVVYAGFAEDAPAAYELFRNFQVEADTQSDWIYELTVQERDPEEIAAEYIEQNREQADSWKPAEDAELGKDNITIGIPPWPGVTVKSRVMAQLLEEMGYTTEVREVDVGVVYTGLADQQIDVAPAGWLPSTHQSYWDEQGDNLEIAGVNITTTWLGLAVPSYVDESVQSLEDLAS